MVILRGGRVKSLYRELMCMKLKVLVEVDGHVEGVNNLPGRGIETPIFL